MKVVDIKYQPTLGDQDNDHEVVFYLDGIGTTQAGSAQIRIPETHSTFVVGKRVDASNYAINLPTPYQTGWEIEVYAEGGSIEIFAGYNGGFSPIPFLDGGASVTTSTGVKFRSLYSSTANANLWARLG